MSPPPPPGAGGGAGATRRLDIGLVGAGLARSRGHARELIDAGHVHVDGRLAIKPSQPVSAAADLRLGADAGPRRVGRAGGKLDAAFEQFQGHGLSAVGLRCLDVGASTGGFTQVLLARGAVHVVALDVGHGQLVPELARDPRVTERSGTNIRDVVPGELLGADGPFGLIVGDLSFISLRLVLSHLAPLLASDGDAVLLIKPQFEVGRAGLDKHGVVRSTAAIRRAVRSVAQAASELGWGLRGLTASTVRGTSGNQEYLGWFTTRPHEALDAAQMDRHLAGAELRREDG